MSIFESKALITCTGMKELFMCTWSIHGTLQGSRMNYFLSGVAVRIRERIVVIGSVRVMIFCLGNVDGMLWIIGASCFSVYVSVYLYRHLVHALVCMALAKVPGLLPRLKDGRTNWPTHSRIKGEKHAGGGWLKSYLSLPLSLVNLVACSALAECVQLMHIRWHHYLNCWYTHSNNTTLTTGLGTMHSKVRVPKTVNETKQNLNQASSSYYQKGLSECTLE